MDPNDGTSITEAKQQAMAALGDLTRLGLSDQADAILDDVTGSMSYDAITNDADHTDEWKQGAYSRAYINAMNTLARRLASAAKSASGQDSNDAANVFGIAGLKGDVASLSISRRDAGDRVEEVNDSVALQRLLAQATRTGDETLARAIAEKAVANRDADTINAFIADRPQLADAATRLWNQNGKLTTLDSKLYMWLASLKPRQISTLQDYEIQQAANGQASAGQWNA